MAVRSLHTEFIELARSLGADDGYAIRIGPSVVYLDPRIGSKGSLLGAQLRISVSTPIAPYEILLRPEGAIDRAGKGMGINRELLTGDPVFDHAVYIETDGQDDDVKRILSEPRVREAVRELVAESFGIAMGGESFVEGSTSVRAASCLRVGFGTKAFADVDALRRVIGILVRLAEDMDRIALGGPYRGWRGEVAVAPATKARFGRGLFSVAWCIAVNVMGWYAVGFGATPPTFGWSAFGKGCVGGAFAWLLFVLLTGALLRGRSTSFRNVIIVAVFSLPTILVGGRVADLLNATLDHAPPHEEPATAILRSRSKGGPLYQVRLEASSAQVDVDGRLRRSVPFSYTALPVRATIGEGALGSPYLVELRASTR
ncbi:MAG: hypothetical protein JST00_02410 [Deltaproteobacteria bacterium]|nr:hypothetical protein [Deltaproteobacteria bacterium]